MATLFSFNDDSSKLLTHIHQLMNSLSIVLEISPEHLILPSKSSRRARKDPSYVPRPMNEWIIYRRNYSLRLLQEGRKVSNPDLAREARDKYNDEPPAVKKFFVLLKEYGKLWHKEQFPAYRYKPHRTPNRRTREKRVNRKAQTCRPNNNVDTDTTTESDSSSADEMIPISHETMLITGENDPEPEPNAFVPELQYGQPDTDPCYVSLFLSQEELPVDNFQYEQMYAGEFDYPDFQFQPL